MLLEGTLGHRMMRLEKLEGIMRMAVVWLSAT